MSTTDEKEIYLQRYQRIKESQEKYRKKIASDPEKHANQLKANREAAKRCRAKNKELIEQAKRIIAENAKADDKTKSS